MEIRKNNSDPQPLTEHLDELRRRIFLTLGCLLGAALLSLTFAKKLILLLIVPSHGLIDRFVLVKPTEIVGVYVKVALYAGCILASPVVLYHAWQFLKPAFPDELRRSLRYWLLSAAALFATGTCFAYKVLLPSGLSFLMTLTREIATPLITLNSYLSFALALLLLGGTIFEIPVIAGVLTQAGIVTPQFMRKKRKEAVFGLCVAAAILTPTTDIFNMALFVLPMIALYEVGIIVSSFMQRRVENNPTLEVYRNEG
jgi:sec-independent protein translocase protein TatC